MGRVQVTIVGAAVALAAATSLAAMGCGGDDGADASASTPQGFRTTQTPDFTLALPQAWEVDKGKQDTGEGEFIEARPPGTDVNRAQVRVASSHDYKSGIASAAQLAMGEVPVRRPGAKRVVSKPVDVPGAEDARRIEWTVPAGGGIAAARIVTVLALSADRTLVNLSVGVAQGDAASSRIDDVVGSLRVGG
jgi:hypothetical protein